MTRTSADILEAIRSEHNQALDYISFDEASIRELRAYMDSLIEELRKTINEGTQVP